MSIVPGLFPPSFLFMCVLPRLEKVLRNSTRVGTIPNPQHLVPTSDSQVRGAELAVSPVEGGSRRWRAVGRASLLLIKAQRRRPLPVALPSILVSSPPAVRVNQRKTGGSVRSRRPERGEALKFKMNVHRRLKMMAFITERARELAPALLRAKRLRYHPTGIRVSFLFAPGVRCVLAGAPFDPHQATCRSF